jgi:hypothetical protein
MQDPVGSLTRQAAVAACLIFLSVAPAAAQTELTAAPAAPQFMSRYDFHLAAAGLAVDDPRFSWDTHFGGEFDFIDYVLGRAVFMADYQAVLGHELRSFDPNQGNYYLSAAASVRVDGSEILGVLHHVSRHLGDREKDFPIAWNVLQARVLRNFTVETTTVELRAQAGKVVARANVDYSWTGEIDSTVRRLVRPNMALYGRGIVQLVGVTPETFGRGTQHGGRFEGGIRLLGRQGAIELFGGYERLIDADPLDLRTRQWAYGGFRLVTN